MIVATEESNIIAIGDFVEGKGEQYLQQARIALKLGYLEDSTNLMQKGLHYMDVERAVRASGLRERVQRYFERQSEL